MYNPGFGNGLLVQPPCDAVLGVLHLEAGGGQLVAYAVAGGPVLGGLGLGAEVEHHVNNLAVGFLARAVGAAFLLAEAQQVEGEEAHRGLQLVEAGGADGCLVVECGRGAC